jgi:putative heme-binding domain-containing protein
LAPFITALHSGTARQQAAAAVALGRIGNLDAAAALLSVPFTKSSDHQRPTITEKFTVKSGRSPDIELAVTPGEELRLHVIATDTVGGEAEVIVRNGVFNLADGSTIGLETLTPTGGNITTHNAPPLSKNKKATPKKYGPAILVTGPALTIYTAPPRAVSFTAKGEPTSVADTAISAEIFASTGRTGVPVSESTGPRHATPNASILVPHLAAHALVRLRAVEACLTSIGTPSEDLALWALSGLHEEASINGLQSALKTASDPTQRAKLLTTLARLHHRESPYDGSWWWTTRPDTRGPYYKPETWSASPQIAGILEAELDGARPAQLDYLARLNDSHRLGLTKLGTRIVEADLAELPSVDLAKIASQKGAVASTPIEDIILAMDTLKPDHLRGAELFTQQGCVACHALESGGPSLGPFMGQVGSIMNVEQIATAILRPNDTISQGFQTVVLTMKDGSVKTGFASETTADKIVLRDLTGGVTTVATADIKDEQHLPISMMPEGLANALSLDELAALVHFLAEKK